ncbi:3-hydroxy-9,10-secoandrosta-1,3,5(10)-triene-9,17-dione monooxygenase [Arthrobacter ginsengisoli]|uniref:3-hydroxy-9,10-secoandrosta-1,3,5(10)-triene-9, 17-dione monooxygenase n=1 Tax=Arthrobacter ginsengisoli TaxID=1356565 RepID=A0ABU1UDJ2_9MICC|nr:acyl-CoA dehydrogenase family protein [Arthrobacter ginsengisoli]MDR7083259.1 3-hydroxy-9,10-secoandrosta-1,3,5(10)-triene-9,17-dione monooxygenase [Arthrobacter ginsengisoli]
MSTTGAQIDIDAEVLFSRIRELLPLIAERAADGDRERSVPADVIAELVDAGVARVLVPRRFGGSEFGLDVWYKVIYEIAQVDMATAWLASLAMHHPHYVAQYPEAAQEEVWKSGPDVVISASIAPTCKVQAVEGGYRISGRSPFTSGINNSTWVMVSGFVPGAGPEPDWRFFLIPASDYTVVDTWDVIGMRGTGSNTVVTEDVFVPEHRVLRYKDLIEGVSPGAVVHPNPMYALPFKSYSSLTFAAPVVGGAKGVYERFVAWTAERAAGSGAAVRDFTSVRVKLSRVAASIDAADMLLRRIVATASGPVRPTADDRARAMRDYSRAVELAVEAVDSLVAISGSGVFGSTHPIQRAWRDIHFASTHISLNPETNYDHYGRLALGMGRAPQNMSY